LHVFKTWLFTAGRITTRAMGTVPITMAILTHHTTTGITLST